MQIVQDIDSLRKLSDKTFSSLAKACGSSSTAVANFFQGKSELGSSKLFCILEDLGIPLQVQVRRKLEEKAGLIDPGAKTLNNDIVVLFEKLNDINKKIVLTSLLKPLANTKDKGVSESFQRIKKRVSVL